MVLWTLTVLAVLTAITALLLVRRQGRRLDALNQSYWELRYDFTRLRSQVTRLDPETEPEPSPAQTPGQVAFVPLSSMKKKG